MSDHERGRSRPRHRSPNFPSISLEEAVKRTERLYRAAKQHPVPLGVAHEKWGYEAGGSYGNQTVAALKAYGLVDVRGTGDAREVSVSEEARRIILESDDRGQILKKCALAPAINSDVWDFYGAELPDDDAVLRNHLIWQKRFNENSVDKYISELRETIAFAGLDGGPSELNPRPPELVWASEVEDPRKGPNPHIDKGVASSRPGDRMKEEVLVLEGGGGEVILRRPTEISRESYEDIEDWLKLVLRKLKRAIAVAPSRPTIRNRRMLEMLEAGEAIDVSECRRNESGDYVLEGETLETFTASNKESPEGIDLCDADLEQWICSVGRDLRTGEVLAATTSKFYESADYECLWLR